MAETPETPAPPPGRTPAETAFLAGKIFPTAPPLAADLEPPPQLPRSRFFSRVVLPIVLFILVVGGIAWLAQYMPNWRKPAQPEPASTAKDEKPLLSFRELRSIWENDLEYALEQERNQEGRYDYLFENVSGETVELGLERTSCDCSKVQVAMFPSTAAAKAEGAKWQDLHKSVHEGIKVPAGNAGFVRLSWTVRKDIGERLNLGMVVWARPLGQSSHTQTVKLDTYVGVVAPLLFLKDPIPLGLLSPRDSARDEVYAWSPTRDDVEVVVDEQKKDPCFEVKVTPLSKQESEGLQRRLKDAKLQTRVRSAFRVQVALHEEKAGHQLDQGPFRRRLPLLLDGHTYELAPMVQATVRGEVEIGGGEEQGRIHLRNFPASEGTQRTVRLYTDSKMTLTHQGQEPPYLEVKLSLDEKESTATRKCWKLQVRVPRGSPPGPLPEDAAVILRSQSAMPRTIRIPVLGLAGQG